MTTPTQEIRVWDPLVRIFHWTLVAAFFTAYLSEGEAMPLHAWAGYLIGGLILVRVLWGLVGSRHARFSDFVRPPREVLAHVKDVIALKPQRYLGHNPAGGLMIIALLLSLTLTVVTGTALYAVDEGAGPLAPWMSALGHGWEDGFEEVHEFLANLTLFLVVVHVAGVLVESLLQGENLVRAMLNGRKPVHPEV